MSEWRRAKRRAVMSRRRSMTRRILIGVLAAAVFITGGAFAVKAIRNRNAVPSGPAPQGVTPSPEGQTPQTGATPTAQGQDAVTPTPQPGTTPQPGEGNGGTPGGDGSVPGGGGTGNGNGTGNGGSGGGTPTPGAGGTVTGVLNGLTVGIDPGHQQTPNLETEAVGPSDDAQVVKMPAGSVAENGAQEYEINLQTALILRDRLESLGAKVVLTRESNDVNLSNQERAARLKQADCDLVLQLHCDGDRNASRTGIYMTTKEGDDKSSQAALALQRAMGDAFGAKQLRNLTAKDQAFLNWSEAPAMLVHMGFLSNGNDAERLTATDQQKRLAEAMAQGIETWYKAKKVNDITQQK